MHTWLGREVATIWYTYQKELHGQSYTLQLSDIKQRGFRKDGYVESMQEIYTNYRQEHATYSTTTSWRPVV